MTNAAGAAGPCGRTGEITALLADRLPDADQKRVEEQICALQLRPQHLTQLLAHLRSHEDALTSGRSDGPACLRALLDVLAEEHPMVRRAGCGRCGTVRRMPYRVDGAGVCSRCYDRAHRKPCVRCGEVGPPAVREDGGVVCAGCVMADPARHEPCARCGTRARVAARVDGQPLCQRCRPCRTYTCGTCGRADQIARAITDDVGPICSRCYQRSRVGTCSGCGRVTCRMRFNSAAGPVICHRCWQPPLATCASCGRVRPCDRGARSGQPICSTCRRQAAPAKACAACGRTARIRTTLPLGPVCGPCFAVLRGTPAPCPSCGRARPLIGVDAGQRRICGPCTGDGRDQACRQCGTVALLHADRRCPACVVAERVRRLLTGLDCNIPAELRSLHQLLLAESPRRVQVWLDQAKWAQLLAELVAAAAPLSHATLDALPQRGHVQHLRQVLVHAGALPERDESLAAVEPWLDGVLAGAAAGHAALIRPYVSWSVLRRGRRRAQRHGTAASAGRYARTRVRAAVQFLTWLETHNLTLAAATQTDVDRWLDGGSTSRYRLRDFLRWAHARGLCADLVVPALGRQGLAEHTLDNEDRWKQLRRCLTDIELPITLRVAGALVLLYGQTPTRIVTLAREDITTANGMTYLALHRQPVLLPPQLADLLGQLARQSAGPQRPVAHGGEQPAVWLFPGARPGAHQRPGYLGTLLNDRLGLQVRPGRGAALCDLAGDLPSPVLAELLGISISTAGRWVALVGRDWTGYVAARDQCD